MTVVWLFAYDEPLQIRFLKVRLLINTFYVLIVAYLITRVYGFTKILDI